MTRAHAARMLLAHGPLAFGEFATITGWPVATCRRVLSYLVDTTGQAMRAHRLYTLTHDNLPDLQAMEPKRIGRHGEATLCTLQPGAEVELLPTAAQLQALQPCRTADHQSTQSLGGQMKINSITKLALDSDFEKTGSGWTAWTHDLEKFAAAVAAAEREACAKLAAETVCDTHLPTGIKIYGTRAAEAIRKRGEQ